MRDSQRIRIMVASDKCLFEQEQGQRPFGGVVLRCGREVSRFKAQKLLGWFVH